MPQVKFSRDFAGITSSNSAEIEKAVRRTLLFVDYIGTYQQKLQLPMRTNILYSIEW